MSGGEWAPRENDPHNTMTAQTSTGYRVYAVQALHEVEFLGVVFTPSEAREFAARLAEAADLVSQIADQRAAAVTR